MSSWNSQKSKKLYNIEQWGKHFFNISEQGTVQVYPSGKQHPTSIDLPALAREIKNTGLSCPLLIRFPDILRQCCETIHQAFQRAIEEYHYQKHYTLIYPIKVNHQRSVIREVLASDCRTGLEAGSKTELMAILALANQAPITIICNGYKDHEFIRLALIAQCLNHKVYIVLEKPSELKMILEEAKKLAVTPRLGLRIRLATIGQGKWKNTSGHKAKFGFSAGQLLAIVEQMKAAGCLSSLQLLHFHIGSQVANIADLQHAIREFARHYVQLHSLGVAINVVDVGGGLGVDYEGTRSRNTCSMNYTVQEYANNIVYTFMDICNVHKLPHPMIISESGRAITAHHALLITDIIGVEETANIDNLPPVDANEHRILRDLRYDLENISNRSALEVYHDASYWLNEIYNLYNHGIMDIKQRAYAEQLYIAICVKLKGLLQHSVRSHRQVLDELNEILANKYFANFSLFQSLPDAWAIQQVFPVLPLSNLDKEPVCRGVIQDLTCDSDGCINLYIDGEGLETTLPLPPFHAGEENLIGIFLIGAYQESLSASHNLFGTVNTVQISLRADGSYQIIKEHSGDTTLSTLQDRQFNHEELLVSYQKQLADSALNDTQKHAFLQTLTASLTNGSYLNQSP